VLDKPAPEVAIATTPRTGRFTSTPTWRFEVLGDGTYPAPMPVYGIQQLAQKAASA
jgi:hypothetical protein